MGKRLNAKSSTGMVHAVSYTNDEDGTIETLCNHRRGDELRQGILWIGRAWRKKWERTDEAVTCKLCFAILYPDKQKTIRFSKDEVKHLIKLLRLVNPFAYATWRFAYSARLTDCLAMLKRKIS